MSNIGALARLAIVLSTLATVGTAAEASQISDALKSACEGLDGRFSQAALALDNCVKRTASKLEPSGGSATEIAEAARVECAANDVEVAQVEGLCRQSYAAAGLDWEPGSGIDDTARDAAIDAVLSIRAARAKCAPTPQRP